MDLNCDRKERVVNFTKQLYLKSNKKFHRRIRAELWINQQRHIWELDLMSDTQTYSNTQSLTWSKLFKLTSIPVLSMSFPKLDRSNDNTNFFLGRACIPLEFINTTLIAAGRVVIGPAHHQLTLQVNWLVSINKWKSIKGKPSNTAVWWMVRGVGRILDTPRKT